MPSGVHGGHLRGVLNGNHRQNPNNNTPRGIASGQYKHGLHGTALYWAWCSMMARCYYPRYKGWKNYGGRGITVCKRWHKFENFAADMGSHPGKGWSLDRIDNNGNYEPNNCRWATSLMQGRNTRRNKLTEPIAAEIRRRVLAGESGAVLGREFGVGRSTVSLIKLGKQWA